MRTTEQLLEVLGQKLELGGPNGNVPVVAVNAGRGWGKNWDALKDSLTFMEHGGIWGTSRKVSFPLFIEFRNAVGYHFADKEGYATFIAILEHVQSFYARQGKQFSFALR